MYNIYYIYLYWKLRLKEKHKKLFGSTFSAYLEDLRGPHRYQGKAELAPSTLLKCFSLVIGSVKKKNKTSYI